MFKIFFSAILTVLFTTTLLSAQTSLVPVHHPIYDWLYNQRVAGNLPQYSYESLPITRGEITSLLNHLKNNGGLSSAQTRSLESYLREFDISRLSPEGGHSVALAYDSKYDWDGGSVRERIARYVDGSESHLALMRSDEGVMYGSVGLGTRTFYVQDGNQNLFTPLNIMADVRAMGHYGSNLGFHIEMNLAEPMIGDGASIFAYDEFYFINYINQERYAGNTLASETYSLLHREGYATARFGNTIGFSIGRGNLKVGVGEEDNLWFSRNAAPIDWIRLDIGNRWFQFQRVHGVMSWPTRVVRVQDDPILITRNSPQRFVVMQSIRLQLFPWMQLGFYEMVNYANRGMEIGYLNPIAVLGYVERDLQDQDNGWGGAFLVLRPVRGLELYTEIAVDDLYNPMEIFRKKERPDISRFGRRYGIQSVPFADWRVFAEYDRIDPFVYTHPFGLTAHTNFNKSLGSQLEPNSDRLMGGFQWFGLPRSWFRMQVAYARQGRSIFDDDGRLIFYAGEDVNRGRNTDFFYLLEPDEQYDESYLFLDGEMHRWVEMQISASWEPRRSLVFSGRVKYRTMLEGDQLNDRTVMWLDMRVGF